MSIEISLLPGIDKKGDKETFKSLIFKSGETLSVVGDTGSGKTALINDIELMAQRDTVTGRSVLYNGKEPSTVFREDPAQKPIAMITQNTKCFTDLTVRDFLSTHAKVRQKNELQIVETTIDLANEFTGEKISGHMQVTGLSGGQTRSLMIADAIIIGGAPIILLDEVENAGIFKHKVISSVKNTNKIIIFVTHDPVIALLTDKRIVMRNGAVSKIITQGESELSVARTLIELDKKLDALREEIRGGSIIDSETFDRVGFDNKLIRSISADLKVI